VEIVLRPLRDAGIAEIRTADGVLRGPDHEIIITDCVNGPVAEPGGAGPADAEPGDAEPADAKMPADARMPADAKMPAELVRVAAGLGQELS
jgi:hypothetical protein